MMASIDSVTYQLVSYLFKYSPKTSYMTGSSIVILPLFILIKRLEFENCNSAHVLARVCQNFYY